jgi:large conductance mechanosensitive channel
MDPLKLARSLDSSRTAHSLYDEFKAFALKGNVIDLAVGVIIGAAFGKIVDSLVKQIIMPLISVVMPGKQGYLEWKWFIRGKEVPTASSLARS